MVEHIDKYNIWTRGGSELQDFLSSPEGRKINKNYNSGHIKDGCYFFEDGSIVYSDIVFKPFKLKLELTNGEFISFFTEKRAYELW